MKQEQDIFKIGDAVIYEGEIDQIIKLIYNDPDGYEVELKNGGTTQFALITPINQQ